ncbi:ATPase, AAA family protein [Cryptosporidium muris RN66]|uniref:ATPase, AAA family protein n=1 Tax=Cryptosporidium muris (strain RN66) TaxID=441375 RepID=B6AGA9_CRYMR|nr:ATPase, AAA family protein [Cryptosporidium muris RN66]EEA07250.1 ATPase, AAA family protein [Cryptosporidium muris RN66]|eukprot:XP_002141599.1 ATPase, AAA family protein [Cryptosporidium muris RN66]
MKNLRYDLNRVYDSSLHLKLGTFLREWKSEFQKVFIGKDHLINEVFEIISANLLQIYLSSTMVIYNQLKYVDNFLKIISFDAISNYYIIQGYKGSGKSHFIKSLINTCNKELFVNSLDNVDRCFSIDLLNFLNGSKPILMSNFDGLSDISLEGILKSIITVTLDIKTKILFCKNFENHDFFCPISFVNLINFTALIETYDLYVNGGQVYTFAGIATPLLISYVIGNFIYNVSIDKLPIIILGEYDIIKNPKNSYVPETFLDEFIYGNEIFNRYESEKLSMLMRNYMNMFSLINFSNLQFDNFSYNKEILIYQLAKKFQFQDNDNRVQILKDIIVEFEDFLKFFTTGDINLLCNEINSMRIQDLISSSNTSRIVCSGNLIFTSEDEDIICPLEAISVKLRKYFILCFKYITPDLTRELSRSFSIIQYLKNRVFEDNNFTGLDKVIGFQEIIKDIKNEIYSLGFNKEFYNLPVVFKGIIGFVISGDKGSGKTFLTKCLAEELKSDLIIINTADIFNKRLGGTEEAIEELIQGAQNYNRITLLFEDIDILLSTDLHYLDLRSSFIYLLDSLSRCNKWLGSKILVIGTTSLPHKIDPYVFQPYRFSKLLKLPKSSEWNLESRFKLFKIHLEPVWNRIRDMIIFDIGKIEIDDVIRLINKRLLNTFSPAKAEIISKNLGLLAIDFILKINGNSKNMKSLEIPHTILMHQFSTVDSIVDAILSR